MGKFGKLEKGTEMWDNMGICENVGKYVKRECGKMYRIKEYWEILENWKNLGSREKRGTTGKCRKTWENMGNWEI